MADAHVAQRANVAGDVGGLAREQPPLAVACLRGDALAESRAAQRQTDGVGLAAGVLRHLAQTRDARLEARQAVERMGGIGADRVPGVTQRRGATQRRPALAADPDRRMRLLYRLGREHDVLEPYMIAGETRLVVAPELDESF